MKYATEKFFETFKNDFYEITKGEFKNAQREITVHWNNKKQCYEKQSALIFTLWDDVNNYIYYPCENKVYILSD